MDLKKENSFHKEYYKIIVEMLNDCTYTFARTYLLSVKQFINNNHYITEAQMNAIDNIKENI